MGADIKAEHVAKGFTKKRAARTVYKSTASLLAVPRYCDLLGDQDDEDETERRKMLVSSGNGWRAEIAKWIGDARDSKAEEIADDAEEAAALRAARICNRVLSWKLMSLKVLFGRLTNWFSGLSVEEVNAEVELMEELANIEEDERLDDGGIEIDNDDEYHE